MKENIALIKEVHHKKKRLEAEKEAVAMLRTINLEHIASYRSEQCSAIERFYVMFIRALMCDTPLIYILSPLMLTENRANMNELTVNMQKLNRYKGIIIIDTDANLPHYKDCGCPMTK